MRRFALLLLVGACRFNSELPATADVSCGRNSDCPSGFGCRQPAGRCQSAFINDATPPGAESVVIAYAVPDLPGRTALGPAGVATVQLELTEPVSNLPRLEAGVGVTCEGPSWRNATVSWACQAASDAPEGMHPLTLRLIDLASNEASLTLTESLRVDTTPPEPLGPLDVASTPYATPPFFGLALSPDRVAPGHLVVGLSADGGVRDVVSPTPSGLVMAIDLAHVRRVTVVDEAGNRAPPTQLERVVETLAGPQSPHRTWRTSSLGPSLTRATDWTVLSTMSGRLPAGFSWVQHHDAVPDDPALVFTRAVGAGELLAVDAAARLWRVGPGGFAEKAASPGLLGPPPFAVDSAWGYDRKLDQLVRVGGAVGPTELTNSVWRLSENTWRRAVIPGSPVPPIRGSSLEWSSIGLALFGGQLRDGTSTDQVWRFTGDDFERTTFRLPAPRAHLATTYETETNSTWMFGGEGATPSLWRWQADGGFEVFPQRAPWPPGGGVVALSPTNQGVLLARAGAGVVSVWQVGDGGLTLRGSAPLGGTDVALAFDVSSDQLLARVMMGAVAELHAVDLATMRPRRLLRGTAPPPQLLAGASFTGGPTGALLFGGALADGGHDDQPWLYDEGWRPAPRGPEGRSGHAAWRHGDALFVIGGTGAGGPLTAGWVFDGGWSALPAWGLRDGSALGPAVGFHLDGPKVAVARDVAGRAGLLVVDPANDTLSSRRFVAGARAEQAVVSDGGVLLLATVGNSTQLVSLPSQEAAVVPGVPNRIGCYEPSLDNLISVGRGGDAGGNLGVVGELSAFEGGRVTAFAPLLLADAYGDLTPNIDSATVMATVGGRCWLLRQGTQGVETWEFTTDPRPAVVFELTPGAFGTTRGHRVLRVKVQVDGGVDCLAHVDGRWRQTSTGSECSFDERLFTVAAGVWRTAVAIPLEGRRNSVPVTIDSMTLETTIE